MKKIRIIAIIFSILTILFFLGSILISADKDTSVFLDDLTYSEGIVKEAKQGVEERQRKMLIERETKGEHWTPKNFLVTYSNESGMECECSPINKWVPPAPIIAL